MTKKLLSALSKLQSPKLAIKSASAGLLVVGLLLGSFFWIDRFTGVSAAPPDALTQQLDTILLDHRLVGAHFDVVVRDAKTGEVLYSRNPDNHLTPASNMKLYTSTSAMEILGPDYRFTTSVATDAASVGWVVNGNLYLKGTGDPTMQASDYDTLAAQVAGAGVHVITGKLISDDIFFDHRQMGFDWAWDDSPFYFQPEISALTVAADGNFNVGSLTVQTRPGSAVGQAPQITTNPSTNFVHIIDNATTGPAGSQNTLAVERQLGVNNIVVSGSFPIDGGTESDLSTITDPSGYARSLFKDALERHGVRVLGGVSSGATSSGARVITSRNSMPLSQLLPYFLKLSNNGIAEILVKAMGQKVGQQGSWNAGLNAMIPVLANLGVDINKIDIEDGSGLSNLNFITSQQTTNLLIGAQSKPWFQHWYDSLPIAGESDPLVGGTLRSRMVGTAAAGNVHGKTGTLGGVSALSGYVTDADGRLLVFSVMENDFIFTSVKGLEDSIAITLANYSKNGTVSPATSHVGGSLQLAPKDKSGGTAAAKGLECSWTKQGC